MKITCIGPKRSNPSFRLSLRANPSLVTNTAQNQQILMVVVIFVALSSLSRDDGGFKEMVARDTSTLNAKCVPIAMRAMMFEATKMANLYISLIVTQTTRTCRIKETSTQTRSRNESIVAVMDCAKFDFETLE